MVFRPDAAKPPHLIRELRKQLAQQPPNIDAQGNPVVSARTVSRFVASQQGSYLERQLPNYGGDGESYPEFKVGSSGVIFVQPDGTLSPYDPDGVKEIITAENGEIVHGVPTDGKKGNGHRPSRRPRGDIRPSPGRR